MKTIALVILLGFNGTAGAGYKEAGAAIKGLGEQQAEDLDGLLAQPGAVLSRDQRTTALLAANQAALELFRQAAAEPNDGYLFAPKPEKLTAGTPPLKLGEHLKLLKLLLIEAKVKAAQKQPGPAEKNVLAAAGFLAQLSAQRAGAVLSSMVEQLCLLKISPVLAESVNNPAVSPAYLKELSALLEKTFKNQDFMGAALLEEAEKAKGSVREGVNRERMAAERAKLGFFKRLVAEKLQDQEFFSMVYGQYNAAADAYAGVITGAFRANDPAPPAVFMDKRRQELLARKQAREKRGLMAGIMDVLKGGAETKKEMAETVADAMLGTAVPSYEKLIPRYHFFLSGLNVMRAALAVKRYQRASRRLPESLGQLVPAYLEAVPQDSFNKFAPLGYIKTGKKFLVYSFGPDAADARGAAAVDAETYFENPSMNAGDIVFSD